MKTDSYNNKEHQEVDKLRITKITTLQIVVQVIEEEKSIGKSTKVILEYM